MEALFSDLGIAVMDTESFPGADLVESNMITSTSEVLAAVLFLTFCRIMVVLLIYLSCSFCFR